MCVSKETPVYYSRSLMPIQDFMCEQSSGLRWNELKNKIYNIAHFYMARLRIYNRDT